MMTYRLARRARRDVLKIWQHITEDNERAADRFIGLLTHYFELLGKELILRGVEAELQSNRRKRGRRVSLPIIRSKRPGSLRLDNAKIYEIIPFP